MKAVNLYVSISRIVYQLNSPILENKYTDLYQLIPYLRQSLSCAVCAKLLIDPYSPKENKCQHFVCRRCVRGKKNIRPLCQNCVECADYRTYVENRQIAIIMQCYKALCEYVMSLPVYQTICEAGIQTGVVGEGVIIPSFSLVEFIEEGANLQDIFVFSSAVPFIKKEPVYDLIPDQKIKIESPAPSPPIHIVQKPIQQLPPPSHQQHKIKTLVTSAPQMAIVNNSCLKPTKVSMSSSNSVNYVNSHSATFPKIQQQTVKIANSYQISSKSIITSAQHQQPTQAQIRHPIKTVSNGSAMYSVVYTGNGNKLTIKRKTEHDHGGDHILKKTSPTIERQMPPKIQIASNNNNLKRRGCRCGNATPTPGKLTCCGQRCPCYVESKSCIDCKCRGCRNPHRPGGGKVRPRIPELDCYEIQMLDEVVPTASATIKSEKINKISKSSLPMVSLPQTTCTTTSQTQPHQQQQQHQQHQRTFIPMKANPTTQHLVFTTNSMCEPSIVKLENMATESLIIQNAEGKLQVVNVLKATNSNIHQQQNTTTTSSGIQQIHTITVPPPHSSNGSNSNNNPNETIFLQNSTQLPDIDKSLPQIIMQPQSSPIITTTTSTTNHHHHHHHHQQHHLQTNNHHQQNSSPANIITMHPIQSSTTISPTTITLSPIIVSSSPNSFPTTIFSDEDFITTTTGGATTMPALVEVVDAHSADL